MSEVVSYRGTEVEVADPSPPTGGALVSVIERALANPNTGVETLERLLAMQERVDAANAKKAFSAALAILQPSLPVINEKGRIEIKKKDTDIVIQSTSYALWEDINDAIRPLLSANGFALSFRIGKEADRVVVTGVLSHRDGHCEETSLSLPMDTSGSKNNVQAIGSSVSYGKRYTAMALLNITSRGEDDDGHAADPPDMLTEDQIGEIQALMEDVGADKAAFLKYMKAPSVSAIPPADYARAIQALEAKRARK
jgi:hypothetical protein